MHAQAPLALARDQFNPTKFNSGVMVIRKDAQSFFEAVWRHNDGGKGNSDHKSINHILRANKTFERRIGVLNGSYNYSPPSTAEL